MATRYWVGGAGNWSSTTKWSATSGGASGASVPTSADDAIFDANSGGKFTATVDTAQSVNSITITPSAAVGVQQIALSARLTTNNLTTTGTAGNNRIWFRGNPYGIAQDFVVNGTVSISDCDFRDIYVIGTAAPISGTRIGDLRGCRGITFDAPKTVYWSSAAGGTWSATNWAATSGGATSNDNFPLAQDTAVIENTGLNTSATVTLNATLPFIGTLDMSTRTNAATISISSGNVVYGNLVTGSGITYSGALAVTFSGRNTQTITSAGKTLSCPITIDSYGGTVELADALNIGSNSLTVTNGTFDTKNYNVTAGLLSSNNSNVRTINLGSSTVTLSNSGGGTNLSVITNLTFNAGTSQINISGSTADITSGGLTFYNLSFTNTSAQANSVTGANTFNNLTVTAPSTAGLTSVSFLANQTINGTLTVAGATAVRRIFLRSSVLGTTRTLTVNSLSAQDCDFRDITIAGTAAGSSPTRAGDCGGNTGITFPAPKTVYWNLAGAQQWSATAWAPGSGGSPDINNFPLAQDTAVFDNTGSAGTITINAAWNIGTFDASLRTSAMTLTTGSNAPFVYGDWKFGTGVTSSSTTGTITFAGRGTENITSNGVTFGCPITIDCFTGTVQLADALTLNSARTLTLTTGTFDAVTYNVTTGLFASTSALQNRSLRMGTGTWTLSGTGTVWSLDSLLPSFYKGTADIVLSDTSSTARAFSNVGGYSFNKLTIGGTTGTSTLTISGNNQFTELASTKTVAHTIALGTTTQTFGAWTVTGTAGNVVTLTGTGTSHVLAGACTSGIDYLAMGSIGFAATSPGEFYAGANSTGTAAAPVYRTAKPADSTRYWVGGTGNWSDTARWSTGSGGAGGASVPRSHDDVVFDSASNATAYTATVNAVTGGIRTKALTIAGPASGNLTLAGSTAIVGIHGDVTLPATGLTRTYSGNIVLSGSAIGRTFTTNGVTLNSAITVNGVGCGWTLGSALSAASVTITITNGAFDAGGFNVTTGSFSSINSNTRSITFGSGTITLSGPTNINFGSTAALSANLTFNAGTSTISCTGTTSYIVAFNPSTFHNVEFTSTAFTLIGIYSPSTFNNITVAGLASARIGSLLIDNLDFEVLGTLTFSPGTNATARTFVRAVPFGTTRTLTCAAVSATDVDFRDITIAGAAAPVSGTRLGDCKGNSGITFDAPKTVYWNLGPGGNWSATAWALTAGSGAAVSVANFPLAQDYATFQSGTNTLQGNGTVTINAAYNIGTIDMSARTSNTMTLATSTSTPSIYGNWINGTGTTLTGTGVTTFAGRGSQTITSAGKTFTQNIRFDNITGFVTLQDAFTTSNNSTPAVSLISGTLDLSGYNMTITAGGFWSTTTTPRTLALGSGTLTVGNSGTSFDCGSAILPTVTGTGTIRMTNASAKTFAGGGISYSGITLDQGGAGTLTITGNNTFANISNTYKATGATTIAMGTTTQRVGNFTASGEAGRVLTVQGTSASSPATLVFTGSGQATTPTTDYLTITGVRAYSLDTTWYAGANSTNNGSLGWYFEAGGGGPIAVYIIESATGSSSESAAGTFNPTISELATGSEAGTTTAVLLGTLSESVTIADAIAAARAFYSEVAEATTASDVVNAAATLASIISESAQGQDALVAQAILNSLVADSAVVEDSVTKFVTFIGSVSEIANAASVALSTLSSTSYVVESTTSQDSSTVESSTFGASANETIQAYDSYSPAGSVYNSSFTGAVSLMDSNQGLNTISLAISENASVADQYAAKFTASTYIIERSVALFGPISVTTIRFDYEAVKDLYSRKRTVYVSRSSLPSERVVIVPAMNRTVYIPRSTVSEERTASVSSTSRVAYADKQAASSAERTVIVN